jgi:multimeric flavodoxin WrbA
MQVLGISGSPVQESKTDRLVKEVLKATRLETDFIKLSDHRLEPCRACLACTSENVCALQDDWRDIVGKVKEAAALVIGGWASFGMLDARTKTFLERLYCLRHGDWKTRGKIAGAVVVGADPNVADSLATNLLDIAKGFGMFPAGKLTALGSAPCLSCQHSQECFHSAAVTLHGKVSRIGESLFAPIEQQILGLKPKIRVLADSIAFRVEKLSSMRRTGTTTGPLSWHAAGS